MTLSIRLLSCTICLLSLFAHSSYAAEEYEFILARGIQKISEQNSPAAIELLQKALHAAPKNHEIIYYTGVAYSRAGRYSEAETMFSEILAAGDASAEVYFEMARLYCLTAKCQKGEVMIAKYREKAAGDIPEEYLTELLAGCRNQETKPSFNISAITGLQYDSNVTVSPFNPPSDGKRQSDTSALLYLVATGTPLKSDSFGINAEYSIYQGLHAHLKDFDILYQRFNSAVDWKAHSNFIPSLGYRFEYTLFGNEPYLAVHTLFSKLTVKESDSLSTEALYEYKRQKYWNSDLFETNSIRTGHQTSIGIKQTVQTDALRGYFFVAGDFDRTGQRYWDFDGYRTGAELQFGLSGLNFRLSAEYSEKYYKEIYPYSMQKRHDSKWQFSIGGTYMHRKNLGFSVSDSFTKNRSNLDVFEHTRNLISIMMIIGVL